MAQQIEVDDYFVQLCRAHEVYFYKTDGCPFCQEDEQNEELRNDIVICAQHPGVMHRMNDTCPICEHEK